jgi:hypothetical protein
MLQRQWPGFRVIARSALLCVPRLEELWFIEDDNDISLAQQAFCQLLVSSGHGYLLMGILGSMA